MDLLPLLPTLVALTLILVTRKAALSLFLAALVGAFLLHGPSPITAISALFTTHFWDYASTSSWKQSAVIFTLTLGAFAALLEKGGGFTAILQKTLGTSSKNPEKKLLFGVYGLGLLCFFDGLANAILLGRVARPLTDSLRISRQFLAYLIDSTSSTVACVAFISTWTASQLSIIGSSLSDAPFEVNPASLFLQSIPANSYCLLSLLLIPLAIARNWQPGPIGKAQAVPSSDQELPEPSRPAVALIPLTALIISIPVLIYLMQGGSDWSWRNALNSPNVPWAMVISGFLAVLVAALCFPKARPDSLSKTALRGATSLAPALLILFAAWMLGSVFQGLGAPELFRSLLDGWLNPRLFPLAIFLLGAVLSFLSGTSWGTFGLLMPLALPTILTLGESLPPEDLLRLIPITIGAVFGGAVFGDHCSPFSDTTIISALGAGCSPTSHVATQLPYALTAAAMAALAYLLMSLQLPAIASTLIALALLAGMVWKLSSGKRT